VVLEDAKLMRIPLNKFLIGHQMQLSEPNSGIIKAHTSGMAGHRHFFAY